MKIIRAATYEILKRLGETEFALPKLRNTPSRRVRIIKKKAAKKIASAANANYGKMQTIQKVDFNVSSFKKCKA